MARSLKEDLSSVLSGGSLYWLAVVYPNSGDSWGVTGYCLSNINSWGSMEEGYTEMTSRLLSISDIDQSIDIFSESAAKIADVKMRWLNPAGDIDPVDYLGRKIEIRMGYGTACSLATSDIFFTGRLVEATQSRHELEFLCRGRAELHDGEIGRKLPETVDKKYRGKIQPIAYGDHTDDNGYLPVTVENEFSIAPTIKADDNLLYGFDSLRVFDPRLLISYAAQQTNVFTLGSDSNKVTFAINSTTTVSKAISAFPTDEYIELADRSQITYAESNGTSVVAPTVILIKGDTDDDDELMQVIFPIDDTKNPKIRVERGYNGTQIKHHPVGAAVYQITDSVAGIKIRVAGDFKPKSFAITHNASAETWKKQGGGFKNVNNGAGISYGMMAYGGISNNIKLYVDSVFEAPGVSGTVTGMYVVCKSDGYAKRDSGSASAFTYARFFKNGEHVLYFFAIESDDGSVQTGSYDNTGSADDPADTTSYKIDEIEDLTTTRFSFVIEESRTNQIDQGRHGVDLESFFLRIAFDVNPIDYDFFFRGTGRKHPGSYIVGSADELIQEPQAIIEDLIRNEAPGMSSADIDSTSFTQMDTDRAGWNLALPIHSDMDI